MQDCSVNVSTVCGIDYDPCSWALWKPAAQTAALALISAYNIGYGAKLAVL